MFNVILLSIVLLKICGMVWFYSVQRPEKTTDLPQATDKFDHIMLYSSPWEGVEPTASVVICTDSTGSCKSNYHMITATTALLLWYEIFINSDKGGCKCWVLGFTQSFELDMK
jgi:hypothetical protein